MNLAHLHLVLNHLPVVGIPVALVFLIIGLYQKNIGMERLALLVLIGLAAVVLPVYLTGEPAEELIEHMPGVRESFIEAHEDAALVSVVLTLLLGVAASLCLWFKGDAGKGRLLRLGVVGLGTVAIVSLCYTAYLGGQIRHTELRTADAGSSIEQPEKIKEGE